MSLDHGMLNLPLAKRGNIDSQLDAYKRAQAITAKAAQKDVAAQHRMDKSLAKQALAEMITADGLLDARAHKAGTTRKVLVDVLTQWAKWEPKKVLKAYAEWIPK